MPELAVKPLTFDEVEALEDRDGLRYEMNWPEADRLKVSRKGNRKKGIVSCA
jgi:hypothetical protein